jgi:hypothetical protein
MSVKDRPMSELILHQRMSKRVQEKENPFRINTEHPDILGISTNTAKDTQNNRVKVDFVSFKSFYR